MPGSQAGSPLAVSLLEKQNEKYNDSLPLIMSKLVELILVITKSK